MKSLHVSQTYLLHKDYNMRIMERRPDATEESSLIPVKHSLVGNCPYGDADLTSNLNRQVKESTQLFAKMGPTGKFAATWSNRPVMPTKDGYLPTEYVLSCLRALISLIIGTDVGDAYDTQYVENLEKYLGNRYCTEDEKIRAFKIYRASRVPVEVSLVYTDLEDDAHSVSRELVKFNAADCMSLILFRLGLRSMDVREKSSKALYKLLMSIGIPWWMEMHNCINDYLDKCIGAGGKLIFKDMMTTGWVTSFSQFLDKYPNIIKAGLNDLWTMCSPHDPIKKNDLFVFKPADYYKNRINKQNAIIYGQPFIAFQADCISYHHTIGTPMLFINNVYDRTSVSLKNLATKEEK